jgi:hypothetical protein
MSFGRSGFEVTNHESRVTNHGISPNNQGHLAVWIDKMPLVLGKAW